MDTPSVADLVQTVVDLRAENERLGAALEAATVANATFVGVFQEVVRLRAMLKHHRQSDPDCKECADDHDR